MTKQGKPKMKSSEELKNLKQPIAELEELKVKQGDNVKLLQPEDDGIYKAVFESSNDSILLIDKKGKIIDFNDRLLKIGGYEYGELKGKNIRALAGMMPKKSLAMIINNFLKRVAGFSISAYEVEMITKNGKVVAIEINAQPLQKDGKIIGELVILRDVTERKQAEHELRNKSSEIQLINSIYDAANRNLSLIEIIHMASRKIQKYYGGFAVVTYFLSEDKQYLLVQDIHLPTKIMSGVEKIIGMKLTDVKIKLKAGGIYSEILNNGEVHFTEDRAILLRMIKECATDKALQKLAPAVVRILGSRSLISIPLVNDREGIGIIDIARHEPLTDDDKKQIQTIAGQLVNVIKRKQAEESLKENEEKYRLIVDNSHDVIITLNSIGKLIYVSPSVHKVLGYYQTDIIGRHFRSIVHPDDAGIVIEAIQRLFKDGYNTPGGIEFRAHHISGEWRWLNASGSIAYDVNGNFLSFIGVLRDISKHKQVEEALKASEENFRNSLDNSLLGTRISGTENYTLYANQAFLDIFGYKNIEEVNVTPPQKYYSPECYTDDLKMVDSFKRGEKMPDQVEIDIIRRDGIIRHL